MVVAKEATANEVWAAVEPIGVRLPKLIAVESTVPLGGTVAYRVPRVWAERKGEPQVGPGKGTMANEIWFLVGLQRLTWKLVVHTLYREKSGRAMCRGLLRRLA